MENKRKLAEPSNQAGDEHDDISKKSKDYEDFLLDENLNTLSTKNLNTVTQIREVLDDATDHDTQVHTPEKPFVAFGCKFLLDWASRPRNWFSGFYTENGVHKRGKCTLLL